MRTLESALAIATELVRDGDHLSAMGVGT